MPIGLVLIVIGYIGASGTTEFSSQVPYLISGGLLGLGLIVVGGVLFLRYSFARFMQFLAAAPHLRGAHEPRADSEISSSVTDRRRTSREDPASTAARTRARRHAPRAAATTTTAPTPPSESTTTTLSEEENRRPSRRP